MHPTKFRHNRATELVYSTHAIECTQLTQPNNAVEEEKIAFYHEILFCLYATNARNIVHTRKSVSREWFVYCTRHRGSSST